MKNTPIFIVGVPRSGTTLLAAMVSAHSRMSCGPETHFFRWLSKTEINPLIDQKTWPETALDFISSINHNNFSQDNLRVSLIDKYQVSREKVSTFLKNSPPSIFSMLSSVTEQYMLACDKKRWVEKTPDHIEYVSKIREYFPESPIIRIIRDPRDNCLSLINVPWGAKTLQEALIFWKRLVEGSNSFFKTDKYSYTIKFEDLLSSPVEELEKLCSFLSEEFEEGMLHTQGTGRSLNSRNVPWKDKASKPLDPERIYSWKKVLSEDENKLAEAIVGDYLRYFRYPVFSKPEMLGEVIPHTQLRNLSNGEVSFIVSNGIRFWKADEDEKPTVRIYLGEPGYTWPHGLDSKSMVVEYTSIIYELLKAILYRNKIYWLSENHPIKRRGKGIQAFIIKQMLKPYKISINTSPFINP